jgi:hypothetical protein
VAAALQASAGKGLSTPCRNILKACCTAVDSHCGTGFWDSAQELWRQAAQEARGRAGEGGVAAVADRALLLGWRRRRDVLLPQLQYTVRAARRYRLVDSAARPAGAAAPRQALQGVPLAASERDVALALVRCANPGCTVLGECRGSPPDDAVALRLLRCRGCAVAGYCGWVQLCSPEFLLGLYMIFTCIGIATSSIYLVFGLPPFDNNCQGSPRGWIDCLGLHSLMIKKAVANYHMCTRATGSSDPCLCSMEPPCVVLPAASHCWYPLSGRRSMLPACFTLQGGVRQRRLGSASPHLQDAAGPQGWDSPSCSCPAVAGCRRQSGLSKPGSVFNRARPLQRPLLPLACPAFCLLLKTRYKWRCDKQSVLL